MLIIVVCDNKKCPLLLHKGVCGGNEIPSGYVQSGRNQCHLFEVIV